MISHYSLRPEDFRYAWANAYQRALLDVGEMQRRSDSQLAAIKDLVDLSTQQTEFGRVNLYKTASVVVEQLRQASAQSQARIDEATRRLEEHANWILERERKLQAQSERLTRQLAVENRKLNDRRAELTEQSIGQRVLHVFWPRRANHA